MARKANSSATTLVGPAPLQSCVRSWARHHLTICESRADVEEAGEADAREWFVGRTYAGGCDADAADADPDAADAAVPSSCGLFLSLLPDIVSHA